MDYMEYDTFLISQICILGNKQKNIRKSMKELITCIVLIMALYMMRMSTKDMVIMLKRIRICMFRIWKDFLDFIVSIMILI